MIYITYKPYPITCIHILSYQCILHKYATRSKDRADDSKAIRLSHIYVHLHILTDKSILYICTEKKENKIFHIYTEIQGGAVAKSYMRKGFLIYEEMRKYFPIYEEAVSHL
jgi:hypothetical protein